MKILDRYMVKELGGPFLFGLAAFTLLFVAGNLLNIARLVSEEHASIWAATQYFVYTLPATLVLTFPMSMLLAVLLAMSRISGDSELVAIRAGGVSLYRVAAPLVVLGLLASIVSFLFQEYVVPYASAKADDILRTEIQSGGGAALANEVVTSNLPNGDQQVTFAQGFDQRTNELQTTTLEVFHGATLISMLVAPGATFTGEQWEFHDAVLYGLQPQCCKISTYPMLEIDIGADPSQLVEQTKSPEDMSRAEIASLLRSGVRSTDKSRAALLQVTFDSKLARPFAALVFTMLAMPLGIRPQRSSSGAGFGISILIVFAFYVASTICLAVGRTFPSLSLVMAWLPNVVFLGAGLWLLREAARV
ncbi:MAG TPA: LptF/LptG family permease [Candidatus Eremiobacteraceae bacterium]|nr:LptF/LptG family permease [Candidatus Eremiobacteraceae bacterium]